MTGAPSERSRDWWKSAGSTTSEPVVAHGDFTMLVPEHEQLYAFTRTLDGTTLTVVANMSSDDGLVPSAEGVSLDGEVLLSYEGADTAADDPLGPWAARVVLSRT